MTMNQATVVIFGPLNGFDSILSRKTCSEKRAKLHYCFHTFMTYDGSNYATVQLCYEHKQLHVFSVCYLR